MIIALMPLASKAQEYTLIEPLPCIAGTSTGGNCDVTPKINLNDYIGYIFKFSIALAAFLAVVMIIWGGFQYMTSEAPFLKLEGKNKIGGAVAGLVMILASYLILATIDPRLVEINTSIPPITFCTAANQTGCVDKSDNITQQLEADLRVLSAEAQGRTNNLISQKQKDEEELKALDYSIDNDGDTLTPEEFEALKIKREVLAQKIRGTAVEINKSIVTTIGISGFNSALTTLNDKSNYTESIVMAEKSTGRTFVISDAGLSDTLKANIENKKENMVTRYDEYISKIGNSDPAAVQLLQKQRDFYLSEIDKQAEVSQLAISYENANGFLNGNDMAYRRIAVVGLNNFKDIYTKELANPQKGREVGLEQEYVKMITGRIELINEALASK